MPTPINIDETLDSQGGANDEVTQTANLRTSSAFLQVENEGTGASSDVDFHLEVRAESDLPWRDWVAPFEAVVNDDGHADPIDVDDVIEVRARVANQDAGNQADVRMVLRIE